VNDSVNGPDALIDGGAFRVVEFALRDGPDIL
jgi:hypothetical protein